MSELNKLSNGKYAYLRRLTTEELLELLAVAPVPAASPEKEAYVDALKEAIIEKENENPTGFFPDIDQQWEQFTTHYLPDAEDAADEPDCTEDAVSVHTSRQSLEVPPKRVFRFRRVWRTAVAAAAAVGCVFIIMVTAQAAGVDVFGVVAQWTEDVFSFRQVPPDSVVTESVNGATEEDGTGTGRRNFSSLQEALDAYGITAVHEPAWLPDGYVLSKSCVEYSDAPYLIILYANYVHNRDYIAIDIMSYEGTPSALIQKENERPEPVEFGGITFYLVENASSSVIAWYDEEYEYYVRGTLDKDTLWETAISMYE